MQTEQTMIFSEKDELLDLSSHLFNQVHVRDLSVKGKLFSWGGLV